MDKKILLAVLLFLLIFGLAFVYLQMPKNDSNAALVSLPSSKILSVDKIKNPLLEKVYGKTTFEGDGNYWVKVGDKIAATNGISVELTEVNIINSNNNKYSLLLKYYTKNKELITYYPKKLSYDNNPGHYLSEYAIKVSLVSKAVKDKLGIKRVNLKVESLEPGPFNSPSDLFNSCMTKHGDKFYCSFYSMQYALPNEIEIIKQNVTVFVEPQYKVAAEKFATAAETVYNNIKNFLGIEPILKPLKIRLLTEGSYLITYKDGILYPMNPETLGELNGNKDLGLENLAGLTHEETHYFIDPAPIPGIFNEGLATLLPKETVPFNPAAYCFGCHAHNEVLCGDKNFAPKAWIEQATTKKIDYSKLYAQNQCYKSYLGKSVGVNEEIESTNGVKIKIVEFLPGWVGGNLKIDIYNSNNEFIDSATLVSAEYYVDQILSVDNFEEWKKTHHYTYEKNGLKLMYFSSQSNDTKATVSVWPALGITDNTKKLLENCIVLSGQMLSDGTLPYLDLNKSGKGYYGFNESKYPFYNSAMCLWRQIKEQDIAKFKQLIKVIDTERKYFGTETKYCFNPTLIHLFSKEMYKQLDNKYKISNKDGFCQYMYYEISGDQWP